VTHPRIAILGGGILGTCTALELARRSQPVTIIEGATRLLEGASRWNEGKIHLGFLYAADPSLCTATRMIPGGLAFPELVARHIGQSLDSFTTDDDVFLVHRESVVDAHAFAAYADRASALLREAAAQHGAPRYLSNVCEPVRRLSPSELAALTTSENIVAGFRVPERSVSTVAVADLLCAAVAAEPCIEVRTSTWIDAVRRRDSGRLDVITSALDADGLIGFDVVVNALWEGRLAIDATLSIAPPAPWTHRFRAGVFGHAGETTLSSAVVCTGPFGDVKRYRDGRVYLSWYESGLLAEGHEMEPPRRKAKLSRERGAQVMQGTLDALAKYFPAVVDLAHEADELEVRGGWVYAIGQGSLADRASTLHQRDKFEITIDRGYISVDTAKYSLAPWLAAKVAETIGLL
jgi:glycine/D-amino acid oxidase-like deaminating enzyme